MSEPRCDHHFAFDWDLRAYWWPRSQGYGFWIDCYPASQITSQVTA